MLIGYARVSTQEQSLDLQIDALTAAGCEEIFSDKISGVHDERPSLKKALAFARQGDTILVYRLDRLGRSLSHLVGLVRDLETRGIGFRSLGESLDTTSAGGKLVLHLFAALSEFERDLLVARTRAGLAAARARGRIGGRPPRLVGDDFKVAEQLLEANDWNMSKVSQLLGVSRATLYRRFRDRTRASTRSKEGATN